MKIICLPFSVASHPLFKYNLAVHRFTFGHTERKRMRERGKEREKEESEVSAFTASVLVVTMREYCIFMYVWTE